MVRKCLPVVAEDVIIIGEIAIGMSFCRSAVDFLSDVQGLLVVLLMLVGNRQGGDNH